MSDAPRFQFVDLDTARTARGVRIVVAGLLPSPWSEAAKGVFRVAGVPVLAVRRGRDNSEALQSWTGADNVPVVLYADEPLRTSWAAMATLASRLSTTGPLLPPTPRDRSEAMGLLHELAGEGGLGWSSRLVMIHASLTSNGARGFPLPVAQNLARRYGYSPEAMDGLPERVGAQLELFHTRLRTNLERGHCYLGGASVSALDVYLATFLTPLTAITEADCPGLLPLLRSAFGEAHEALGGWVSPELLAHRALMFERHLEWPIRLA